MRRSNACMRVFFEHYLAFGAQQRVVLTGTKPRAVLVMRGVRGDLIIATSKNKVHSDIKKQGFKIGLSQETQKANSLPLPPLH